MVDRVGPLLAQIRACRLCEAHLPLGPRPVLQASATSRLLIVSQAPGRKVHLSGVPFDDVSGQRLREWLGIERDTFYDAARVAIVPMGFCFPGSGRGGAGGGRHRTHRQDRGGDDAGRVFQRRA